MITKYVHNYVNEVGLVGMQQHWSLVSEKGACRIDIVLDGAGLLVGPEMVFPWMSKTMYQARK